MAQLHRTHELWAKTYDSWDKANDVLHGVLENIERLLATPNLPRDELERERLRLESVARAAEHGVTAAQMNIAKCENLERYGQEQLRWIGNQRMQASMNLATWTTAIVALAALVVSGFAAWSASKPPPPVRVEIVQSALVPPGPWRPDIATSARQLP
jgi:hypothetical protein